MIWIIFPSMKTYKFTYPNIKALLKARVPSLVDNLNKLEKAGSLPLLKSYITSRKTKNDMKLATVPELVLDREMYEPSKIMRSIQYIFDNNVVRIWNDEILKLDNGISEFSAIASHESDGADQVNTDRRLIQMDIITDEE